MKKMGMLRLLKFKPLYFVLSNQFLNCLELIMFVVLAVRGWMQKRRSFPQ